jgi:hypothetical protein
MNMLFEKANDRTQFRASVVAALAPFLREGGNPASIKSDSKPKRWQCVKRGAMALLDHIRGSELPGEGA